MFNPPKNRLPSYSTIRRILLHTDYQTDSACLAGFFEIQPLPGDTIAVDGKVLRGSYEAIKDDPQVASHPAILLVSAYLVERELILKPYEVDSKTNQISALPVFIKQIALNGVVFAFDAISTQKNSSGDYWEWERANRIEFTHDTRYYVASFIDSVQSFAERIWGYWGIENKVHHVRDVTQGEDASRIRTASLPQIWTVARNLALNLYREHGYKNMAQAQRFAGATLNTLKKLFRMK